jgi:pimeloyl-ACP methyl ester carboxylesterase
MAESQGRALQRTVKRVGVILAGAGAAGVLAGAGVLRAWSPGRTRPFLDEGGRPQPGSVSEKIHVDVNGTQQGMFLRGRDRTRPVLLFLHGGPGMPEYFLDRTHPTGLDEDFVVCWWEQRGAGMSFSRQVPTPASMTVEQLIDDTIVVTDYLRDRFGTAKVYLMGHSWGSFLGIQVAARAPERYHAYIGMGQVSWQQRAERLAYEYELEQLRRAGDAKMVRKLERAPVTLGAPLPAAYMKVRDAAMHRIGIGTTREMKSVVTGVFVPVWQTPDYTLREKVAIWRGKAFSRGILWDEFQSTDLTRRVTELELPVYICQGKYDFTTNHDLARTYWAELRAPAKGFYTFEHSAHSPAFEEPERFRRIMREDVLAGETGLADAFQERRGR